MTNNNESNVLTIVFLDVDGVILPFPANETNCPKEGCLFPKININALRRLLQVTDAKLVLSSTWRSQPSFVRDILSDFELHNLEINEFYSMTDPNYHAERQWEIYKWLKDHHYDDKGKDSTNNKNICWLALDDEELIEGDENAKLKSFFQGHVIKTESSMGLTEEDVDKGIQLWKAPLNHSMV